MPDDKVNKSGEYYEYSKKEMQNIEKTGNIFEPGDESFTTRRPVPKMEYLAKHEYMQHSGTNWRVTWVAVLKVGCDWACYVSASCEATVPGRKAPLKERIPERMCMLEGPAVLAARASGNKVSEEQARAVFPGVKEAYRT